MAQAVWKCPLKCYGAKRNRPEYAEDVLWRNAEKLLLVEAGHDLNKVSEGNPLELCSGQQAINKWTNAVKR